MANAHRKKVPVKKRRVDGGGRATGLGGKKKGVGGIVTNELKP